jgi:hypothetical protein
MIGALFVAIILYLIEQRWVNAAFWLTFLILQVVLPKHFPRERLVKGVLVTAMFALLFLLVLDLVSRWK